MGEHSLLRIEELSLNAWPALKTVHHEGCILRFANGYTKRSNSVNPLYHTGRLEDIVSHAEKLYTGHGLPTIFKMLEHPMYEVLDTLLESHGYSVFDSTTVMIVPLAERSFSSQEEIRIDERFTPAWLDRFIECNRLEPKKATVLAILDNIVPATLVASAAVGGKYVAFGFGVLEGEYVGFFDIFVQQDYRGQGWGRRLMEALLRTAREKGAVYGYLQVMDDNHPARALYDTLGFKPLYRYWYRKSHILVG